MWKSVKTFLSQDFFFQFLQQAAMSMYERSCELNVGDVDDGQESQHLQWISLHFWEQCEHVTMQF